MTFAMELAPLDVAPVQPEQQPLTAEELETQVLKLTHELNDPESWLHQNFYGALGVTPTDMVSVNRPAGGHRLQVKNETEHHLDLDGRDYNAATFKRRGALLAALVAYRDNPELERFVTASAGNHALGVAFAARTLGKEAHIYCRSDLSEAKEKKLLELGAILHKNEVLDEEDDTLEYAMDRAMEAAGPQPDGSRPNHFIHPFDQVEVIAGQYTVGREIVAGLEAQQAAGHINLREDPVEIEAAVGGGGHAAGIAIAVKEAKDQGRLGQNVKVRGARIERGRQNKRCDGTATNPGKLPMLILCDKQYVENVDQVSDLELADAMHELTGVFNRMAEPAGSLSYALAKKRAAAKLSPRPGQKPTTYISTLTGANVTRETYGYYMDLRNAAYHENLRSLGSLMTNRLTPSGVDA
ncbi:MAG TPA: pyridoxal-phosphate dependent enzyme, partial [Candidatus Saccharimonadales bacterium]|nr:pyridoxal-phosphate dependent enzyme [Candidatus Saccharimonadales bacterium]